MPLDSKQHKYLILIVCAALAIVTLAVYWSVGNYEFIDFDDDAYVFKNSTVQSGLSLQNIKWAFTTVHCSYWHPLTWFSLMLDCQLFGVKAGPMHLVNVAFHIANTLLLFIIFNRMTKRLWPSAFIAALFAFHPLNVESVAWIAERKNVLSTLFWLLTMLAYVRYAEKPKSSRYIITLIAFTLGLMSKPMLVTLPFVLLLLDFWPLDRFSNQQSAISNLFLEKLPFIFLSAILCIITFIAQQKVGAMAVMPLKERIANAVVSYLAYIEKLFMPVNLAVLYPYPAGLIQLTKIIIFALFLILLTVLLLYYGRRFKFLAFGWLWYLGTLVPVIGIIQVGAQTMADRYAYVPFIGLFVIIAFGAADFLKTVPFKKIALTALASVSLIACIALTSIQLKYWQNSISLFERTLALTKNNFNILNNYGTTLVGLKKYKQAVQYLAKAVELCPEAPDFHNNLGASLKGTGRLDEAIEQYKIALKLDPGYGLAHQNLAIALAIKGDYDGAIEQYKIYLGPNANVAELYQDLARLLVEEGKTGDAAGQLEKALAVNPDSVKILTGLGYALAQSGKPDQAVEYYYKALQLDPNNILVHGRLAMALGAIGKIDDAIVQCRIVLAADPNDAEMHNNLGILLRARGQLNEAAESFRKALQIDPNFQPARENLNALAQKQQ
ncbi:MAG: tetratricopeptide repeat protein [Sedimentisphaerales bacterium]